MGPILVLLRIRKLARFTSFPLSSSQGGGQAFGAKYAAGGPNNLR